jgi:hypothetical protein
VWGAINRGEIGQLGPGMGLLAMVRAAAVSLSRYAAQHTGMLCGLLAFRHISGCLLFLITSWWCWRASNLGCVP